MRVCSARLAALCALVPALVSAQALPETTSARPLGAAARLAVFRASGFPTIDAKEIAPTTLEQALAGLPATVFDSPEALASGLSRAQADVLLLPYGSAFPLEAWPAIRGFVKAGGGLVVLGGAPFEQPVLRPPPAADGTRAYVLGTRQPSFAHDLLIGPVDRVDAAVIAGPLRIAPAVDSDWEGTLPLPEHAFALTVRLATRKDLPSEGGSEGLRDAVLRPLLHALDRDGLPRACPADEHRPPARRGRRRALGARPLGRGARRGRDPAGDAQGPGGRRAARGEAAAGLGRARRDPRDPRAGVPAGAARE